MIHGIWTEEELEKVKNNTDPFLTTEFFNQTTWQEGCLPILYELDKLRKKYAVWFGELQQDDAIEIYATDDENLFKFIRKNYIRLDEYPPTILEIITEYREVEFK